MLLLCAVLHNISQINEDDYVEQDGMLEEMLAHKRKRPCKKRQNDHGLRKA